MTWHSPKKCEGHCCDDDEPCDPPVVTCRKFDDGPYSTAKFVYSVEGAVEAWISETCGTNPSTTTNHPIELDETGSASGEYYTLAGCTYCITATNSCGTVACCDDCTTPQCFIESVVRQADGSVRVVWRYQSTSSGGGGDPIVSATLNGVSILDNPYYETGETYIAQADLPVVLVLSLANDCGKTVTCEYPIPCCWRKSQLRISLSGITDINFSCSYSGPTPPNWSSVGFGTIDVFEHVLQITGFTAANGTHLFDLFDGICRRESPAQDKLLGSGTFYQKQYTRGNFFTASLVPYHSERQREIEGTFSLYLRPDGGLYLLAPSNGYRDWGFQKINGSYAMFTAFNMSPYDGRFCPYQCTSATYSPINCVRCVFYFSTEIPSSCGNITNSNIVFTGGFSNLFNQIPETDFVTINHAGCVFPASFINGTAETEYLV